jgi:hypothetical protein
MRHRLPDDLAAYILALAPRAFIADRQYAEGNHVSLQNKLYFITLYGSGESTGAGKTPFYDNFSGFPLCPTPTAPSPDQVPPFLPHPNAKRPLEKAEPHVIPAPLATKPLNYEIVKKNHLEILDKRGCYAIKR